VNLAVVGLITQKFKVLSVYKFFLAAFAVFLYLVLQKKLRNV